MTPDRIREGCLEPYAAFTNVREAVGSRTDAVLIIRVQYVEPAGMGRLIVVSVVSLEGEYG